MNHKSDVIIFTDGSSRGNPGPGGWAAVIVLRQDDDGGTRQIKNPKFQVTELGGREEYTTNNRMELQAAIAALSFLESYELKAKSHNLTIYSDSSYLINGITEWVFGWQKNNWITSAKKPVENRDLWEKLHTLTVIYRSMEWKQVDGHAGVAGNERCDEIATAFADMTPTGAAEKPQLYHGALEGYPVKNILDISCDISHEIKKRHSRAHARAKAYSYVSAVGGKIETHKTWTECERRVRGVRGARYKKAASAEDEKLIIAEFDKK